MTIIDQLLKDADQNKEIIHTIGANTFRIDLKPDDLKLWADTLSSREENCNLLLACAHSEGPLTETQITWVVGSAIRSLKIQAAEEIVPLLRGLGIDESLACNLPILCPGLGSEQTWAFYLDRKGTLCASPVLQQA